MPNQTVLDECNARIRQVAELHELSTEDALSLYTFIEQSTISLVVDADVDERERVSWVLISLTHRVRDAELLEWCISIVQHFRHVSHAHHVGLVG